MKANSCHFIMSNILEDRITQFSIVEVELKYFFLSKIKTLVRIR
jgi:hypothetical protein